MPSLSWRRFFQIVEHDKVGESAGRDGAVVGKSKVDCRVQRCHADRKNWIEPQSDGLSHDMINVSLVTKVRRVAIISAETDAVSVLG